jgi:hypothetical protein
VQLLRLRVRDVGDPNLKENPMAKRKTAAKKDPALAPVDANQVLPPFGEVDAFTQALTLDAQGVLAFVERLVIAQASDREVASNALTQIAQHHDTADAKRKKWVSPLKAVASDIDATFRPALQHLKKAEVMLKTKIGQFDVVQEDARRKALAQTAVAAAAGNQVAAERAYAKAEEHAPPDTGASSKLYWTGEVIDAALVPREFLMPDVAKLEAITRARGEDPRIAGWRAFQVADVRTSRRGVG